MSYRQQVKLGHIPRGTRGRLGAIANFGSRYTDPIVIAGTFSYRPPQANLPAPVTSPSPVNAPAPSSNGGYRSGNWRPQSIPNQWAGVGGSSSQNNAAALQTALSLYQTSPSSLTQAQWTLLQQNGYIASTLPYSSASQIATPGSTAATSTDTTNDPLCVAAGMTGGPYPNCTAIASAASAFTTDYYGLPLWGWLAGGAVALYMFRGRRRR